MMKSKLEKKRAQVKSRWYYIFWGTATVAVVAGQIYVGNGYREMSETLEQTLKEFIVYAEWKDRNRQSL